jgi:hypothetical protein
MEQLYNRTDLLRVKPGEHGGVDVEVRVPIVSPPAPPPIGRA